MSKETVIFWSDLKGKRVAEESSLTSTADNDGLHPDKQVNNQIISAPHSSLSVL